MNRTFLSSRAAFRTLASPWDTLHPALCRERVRLMSVLLDQRSFLLTLQPTVSRLCSSDSSGITPLSDSSKMCMRAVRPRPSPAVLRSASVTDISEVSRFSCMSF